MKGQYQDSPEPVAKRHGDAQDFLLLNSHPHSLASLSLAPIQRRASASTHPLWPLQNLSQWRFPMKSQLFGKLLPYLTSVSPAKPLSSLAPPLASTSTAACTFSPMSSPTLSWRYDPPATAKTRPLSCVSSSRPPRSRCGRLRRRPKIAS